MMGDGALLALTAASIVVMIGLIAGLRLSAVLGLVLATAGLGLAAGMDVPTVIGALQKGFGEILGAIGLVLVLGAMFGAIVAGSGGADRLALLVSRWKSPVAVAWGVMGVALLVGLPLFFETGFAILMPIIMRIAQRLEVTGGDRFILVAMPTVAGLSVAHGLLPPHPGALAATSAIGADLGLVMLFGLLIAAPTAALAGPLYTSLLWTRTKSTPNPMFLDVAADAARRLPGVGVTLAVLFLPVVLIGAGALADVLMPEGAPMRDALRMIGQPVIALLISLVAAWVCLGLLQGRGVDALGQDLAAGGAAIAGIVLIIGAGGALKEVLLQSGVGDAIGRVAASFSISAILLGWIAAALVRVATGSATVATVTAAGLAAPLAASLGDIDKALVVLAIGGGSLIFSHVNNSAFWMVRDALGLSLADTFKTWSALETIIAVAALVFTLALSALL